MFIELPEPDAEILIRAEDRDGNEVDTEAQGEALVHRAILMLVRLPGKEVVARATIATPPNRSVQAALERAADRLMRTANKEGLWL